MNESLFPGYVRLNVQTFFDPLDDPRQTQPTYVGLASSLSYRPYDGSLCVKGGLSDVGMHDILTGWLGCKKGTALPDEMRSRWGMVRVWLDPSARSDQPLGMRMGIIAGQDDRTIRPESNFSYGETDRQLRMAGAALLLMLEQPLDKLRLLDGREMIISRPVLACAMRRFARVTHGG